MDRTLYLEPTSPVRDEDQTHTVRVRVAEPRDFLLSDCAYLKRTDDPEQGYRFARGVDNPTPGYGGTAGLC